MCDPGAVDRDDIPRRNGRFNAHGLGVVLPIGRGPAVSVPDAHTAVQDGLDRQVKVVHQRLGARRGAGIVDPDELHVERRRIGRLHDPDEVGAVRERDAVDELDRAILRIQRLADVDAAPTLVVVRLRHALRAAHDDGLHQCGRRTLLRLVGKLVPPQQPFANKRDRAGRERAGHRRARVVGVEIVIIAVAVVDAVRTRRENAHARSRDVGLDAPVFARTAAREQGRRLRIPVAPAAVVAATLALRRADGQHVLRRCRRTDRTGTVTPFVARGEDRQEIRVLPDVLVDVATLVRVGAGPVAAPARGVNVGGMGRLVRTEEVRHAGRRVDVAVLAAAEPRIELRTPCRTPYLTARLRTVANDRPRRVRAVPVRVIVIASVHDLDSDDLLLQVGVHRRKVARVDAGVGRRDGLSSARKAVRIRHRLPDRKDVHHLLVDRQVVLEARTLEGLEPLDFAARRQGNDRFGRQTRHKRVRARQAARQKFAARRSNARHETLAIGLGKCHDRRFDRLRAVGNPLGQRRVDLRGRKTLRQGVDPRVGRKTTHGRFIRLDQHALRVQMGDRLRPQTLDGREKRLVDESRRHQDIRTCAAHGRRLVGGRQRQRGRCGRCHRGGPGRNCGSVLRCHRRG